MRGTATRTEPSDRRRHPRRECRLPVVVVASDGSMVRFETVDVSIGGMRIVGHERVAVGPIQVVVDEVLALHGEVAEEIVDLADGTVTARIIFGPKPDAVTAELVEIASLETPAALDPDRRRRPRVLAVLGGAALVGLLVVGGVAARSGDTDDARLDARAPRTATTLPSPAVEPTHDVVVPRVSEIEPVDVTAAAPTPTTVAAPAPARVRSAAPAAAPAPEPVDTAPPASDAEQPPAPAPTAPATVTTAETADNTVTITIAEDPADNRVASTVGPSSGVDPVRVQLTVAPEPTANGHAVWVTIVNQGDTVLTFDSGAEAVVRATRGGSAVEEITVRRADVVELAPGESVELEGVLALSEPGTYELATVTRVTTSS